jgi:hypothetical protein
MNGEDDYANPGEMTARVHWVVTPPIYSLS